jgi:uncharacterized protein (DUF1778 family)
MHSEKATDQVNFRIQPQSKNLLQEAANLKGIKLTEFILAAAESEAKKVIGSYIQNREVKILSAKDWSALISNLENPPPLNAKMKRLLAKSGLKHKKDNG